MNLPKGAFTYKALCLNQTLDLTQLQEVNQACHIMSFVIASYNGTEL